jgi:hypothetical protein
MRLTHIAALLHGPGTRLCLPLLLAHPPVLPHGAILRSIAGAGMGHVALLLAPALATHLAVAALTHATHATAPTTTALSTTGLGIQRQGQGGQRRQGNSGKKNSLVHDAFLSINLEECRTSASLSPAPPMATATTLPGFVAGAVGQIAPVSAAAVRGVGITPARIAQVG